MKRALFIVGILLVAAWFTRADTNISQPASVKILGNAAAAVDAANNAAAPANVLAVGVQEQSVPGNPTAGTSGNVQRPLGDVSGDLFVRQGSSNPYSCLVTLSTLTTTQCEAAPAAGLRAYVTSILIWTTTAGSATTLKVEYGTGSNCVTGPTVISSTFANTATGQNVSWSDGGAAGLVPATANAICVVQAGTTAGTSVVQLSGFVAP